MDSHEARHQATEQSLGGVAENTANLAVMFDQTFDFVVGLVIELGRAVVNHLDCESCSDDLRDDFAERMEEAKVRIEGTRAVIEATAIKNLAAIQDLRTST